MRTISLAFYLGAALGLCCIGAPAARAQNAAQNAAQDEAQSAPLNAPSQTQASDREPALTFEVATIKPAAPSPDGHTHINYPPGDRFSAQNITLLALMDWAWRLPQMQILNGPSWLGSTRFDLAAKLTDEDTASHLSGDEDQGRKRRMVEALLADRCNLKSHRETRELPAYDLVLAKSGARLPASTASGRTVNTGSTYLNAQGLTAGMIAEQLSNLTGRVVVDRTGLPDRYDLKLRWTPDDRPSADPQAPPDLFTALQEQLGLKLESAKEPVPVLVIDHIDAPSAN